MSNRNGPYVYEDVDGPSFRVIRKPDKTFPQESWTGSGWINGRNGTPDIPYNLIAVREAVERGGRVYIPEGEKDCEAAREVGAVATCNPGGAGKWKDPLSTYLVGAREVVIVYDRDEPGYRHAWKVKASLKRAGVGRVRFARARKGKDLADHLDAGYRLDQLVMLSPPPVEVEADPLGEGVAAAVTEGEPPPAMFQLVLAKLRERAAELRHKPPVEQPDGNWKATCPAHDDKKPSLSVGLGTDRAAVLHCFRGCETRAVVEALGIRWEEFAAASARVENGHRWRIEVVTEERWTTAQNQREPDWLIPGVFERTGLYEVVGDLGAGKTMVELGLIVKYAFPAGFRCGRIDLENDFDALILPRLVALGATYEQVRDQFVFMPDWNIRPGDMDDVIDLLRELKLDYLSFDALLDMYTAWGADATDTQEPIQWAEEVTRRIMRELGPCVVGLDHFGRHNKTRAIGGIGKGLNVTGSWNVSAVEAFSREQVGMVELNLGEKNRTGWLPLQHRFRVGGEDGRIVFESVSQEQWITGAAEKLLDWLLADETRQKLATKELQKAVVGEDGVAGLGGNNGFYPVLDELEGLGWIERVAPEGATGNDLRKKCARVTESGRRRVVRTADL